MTDDEDMNEKELPASNTQASHKSHNKAPPEEQSNSKKRKQPPSASKKDDVKVKECKKKKEG
jgi:hypothetical protein